MGARGRATLILVLLLGTALAGCTQPGADDGNQPNPTSTDGTDEATLRLDHADGLNVTLTLQLPADANHTQATWQFASHLTPRNGNLTETHAYEQPGRYTVTATAGNHTATRTLTVDDGTDDGTPGDGTGDGGQDNGTEPDDPSDGGDNPPATQGFPPTVVAIIDTGINPYHDAFRRAGLTAHPNTYLPGYPADAQPLHLTLDDGYNADADASAFDAVERGGDRVYYIPGTNVVAAVSFNEYSDTLTGATGTIPILDEHGHGTASAGVAAGRGYAAAPDTTLLVIVEVGQGHFEEGIRWAAEQPYIDALSVSLGTLANVGTPAYIGPEAAAATRLAAENGKLVFIASGNGVTSTGVGPDRCSTYTSGYTGPAWVTRVGAAIDDTGENQYWHCVPVDLIAEEYQATAAHGSADGEARASGTSGATPTAAGYAAKVLSEVRRQWGDPTPGTPDGLLVDGPGGTLDRDAFRHAFHRAAEPVDVRVPPSLRTEPTHPAYYTTQGWGFMGPEAADRAVRYLTTDEALPERADVEAFMATDHDLRVELWGSPP